MTITFPETRSTTEIIESFAWTLFRHHQPSGPGQAVMECDEATRERFRALKSDDLKNIRPDIGALFGCMWDYKETWQANLGKGPPTRIKDVDCSAMLLDFDKRMLGIECPRHLIPSDVQYALCHRTFTYWYENKRDKRPSISS